MRILTLLLALMVVHSSFAGSLCQNPKKGYASISFGMTSFWGNSCKTQLARAKWLGFTAVSVSPAFYYVPDGTVEVTTPQTTFNACLDEAKSLGFDITYKPMIEALPAGHFMDAKLDAPRTLEDSLMQTPDQSTAPWRAYFDFTPGRDYLSKVMDPFMTWMETNKSDLSHLKVSIVVATELHRSIVEHGLAWNNLMTGMRTRLAKSGMAKQIEIGLDPTVFGGDPWLADYLKRPLTATECSQYQDMLWTADFFSPSVYGDYIIQGYRSNPEKSVEGVFTNSHVAWEKALLSRKCMPSQSLMHRFQDGDFSNRDKDRTTKVAWAGEIGYGGALNRTWSGFDTDPPYHQGPAAMDAYRRTTLVKEQQNFIDNAPIWAKGVLDFSRAANQDTVSFWITGRFDIFGFSDLPPLGPLNSHQGEYTTQDPAHGADAIPAVAKLRDILQTYTRERCGP